MTLSCSFSDKACEKEGLAEGKEIEYTPQLYTKEMATANGTAVGFRIS